MRGACSWCQKVYELERLEILRKDNPLPPNYAQEQVNTYPFLLNYFKPALMQDKWHKVEAKGWLAGWNFRHNCKTYNQIRPPAKFKLVPIEDEDV